MPTTPPDEGSSPSVATQKQALRLRQRQLRRAMPETQRQTASQAIAARVIARLAPLPPTTIAAYWPMPFELDPRPCFAPLQQRGHIIALPVVETRAAPLIFREWSPGLLLEPGGFGTSIPPASQPLRQPTVVLVPLLAFDPKGDRLGYGGGYYDRTLAALRTQHPTLAIGLAFASLCCEQLPTEATDQRLDEIITEDDHLIVHTAM